MIATAHLARSAEIVAAGRRAARRRRRPPRHYADLADPVARGVRPRVRHRRRPGAQRRADRLRARAGVGAAARRGAARRGPAAGWPTWCGPPGFRISTGFVGTPLIADALTDGRRGRRWRTGCCCRPACPSWLYPVTMGATTVWERWDSMLPDGSINPGEMTSFNHYALGAVADWLHRRVAGLAPAAPGYREIEVRPLPGRGAHPRVGAPPDAVRRGRRCPGRAATAGSRSRSPCRSAPPRPCTCPARPSRCGSGTASTSSRRPIPCADEPALPADATVRDVLDHEPTWAAVVAAAAETGVADDGSRPRPELAALPRRAGRRDRHGSAPRGFVPGADDFSERVARIFR